MNKGHSATPDTFYPLRTLTDKLTNIPFRPLSVIEAPSGFGKTTAAREYFRTFTGQEYRLHWLTLGEENRLSEWEVFCSAISRVNKAAGNELEKLSVLHDDKAFFKIHNILTNMGCPEKTFVVLDNHQFASERLPLKCVEILCNSLPENLHFLVITPKNAPAINHMVSNGSANHIGEKYLTFTPHDIQGYFETSGFPITDAQAESIFSATGGWIAAIYLTLKKYAEEGDFDNAGDTMKLVETAIWKKIDIAEQAFLMRLCFFDSFNVELVRFMNSHSTVESAALNTLKNTGFVYYDATANRYFVHSILHRYIKSVFALQSRDFQTEVLRMTAAWHGQAKQNFLAVHYYAEIEDYESIFNLKLASSDFTANASPENKALLLRLLEKCPELILLKYPRAVPVLAFALFVYNETSILLELCDKIQNLLSKDKTTGKEIKNVLSGELAFITAFLAHNDFAKMCEGYRHAHSLIGGVTSVINKSGPWTFGSPSILYMFYRHHAETDTVCMEKNLKHYLLLTNGHGTGADCTMRAELQFNMGDMDASEITAHKAAFQADSEGQTSIYLCAVCLLAQVAIIKGDGAALNTYIKLIEERADTGQATVYYTTLSLVRGFLGAVTENAEIIPEWLQKGEVGGRVRFMTAPYANIIYTKSLLLAGEYAKLAGIGDILLKEAAHYPNALAQIYIAIHLSIAYEALTDRVRAMSTLQWAAQIALPNKIYMPFAQNNALIGKIMEQIPDISSSDAKKIDQLAKRWTNGVNKINARKQTRLTQREMQVALLVAEGAPNKAIAAKLGISPSTVKNLLARIFKKSGLSSRSALGKHIDKLD